MAREVSLTKTALKRLRGLAQGNEIAPESIQLIESKEDIYSVVGHIQLTSRSSHRTRDHFGRVKAKGGKVLGSITELTEEVKRIEKEASEGTEWVEQALVELEKTAGHGWGHRDSHLSWSDQETILTATENCKTCHGSAQIPCQECQGIGSTHCVYCQQLGEEPCQYCNGTGRDQSNQQNPCGTCHGRAVQPCRMCFGKKRMECRICHSKGQAPCTSCRGKGCLSREVRVRSGADISFSLKSTSGLPSGLLRSMSRVKEENIHKGHADIEMIPPNPDAKTPAERSRIKLIAKVPYADLKVRFGEKGTIVSCFGKNGRLTGVPSFLDDALKVSRSFLQKASTGKMPVEKALGPRLMKDALKLNLSGKSHPNHLRSRYPVGLTGNAAQEIMRNMAAALKQATMKARTNVAIACSTLSFIAFTGVFLSPFYEWAHKNYNADIVLIGEVALPLITLSLSWLALHSIAQNAIKRRFPSAQITASPNLGVRGYSALSFILFSYIGLILYAKNTFTYLAG